MKFPRKGDVKSEVLGVLWHGLGFGTVMFILIKVSALFTDYFSGLYAFNMIAGNVFGYACARFFSNEVPIKDIGSRFPKGADVRKALPSIMWHLVFLLFGGVLIITASYYFPLLEELLLNQTISLPDLVVGSFVGFSLSKLFDVKKDRIHEN